MKDLAQEYHINAPVEKVWAALINSEVIDKWGGGPAKMDDKVGTQFTLWGGDIHGTNKEVEKEKKLIQEWFGGDWEKPSIVEFILASKDNGTEITLHQENIPEGDFESISEGWEEYYLGAIKKHLEA